MIHSKINTRTRWCSYLMQMCDDQAKRSSLTHECVIYTDGILEQRQIYSSIKKPFTYA